MTQVRVNISTLVNASKIRHETRDGRKVIVVPSATLPDNVVMNGIRYPAAVIAESFRTLEGTLAPLGHPMVNGKFVSAKSAEGLPRGYIGAHNENVRRENGRVFLDKVIDVEYAQQLEGGRRILNAIEKQEPLHTSTGLLATLKPLANATDGAKFEAETMLFDQDALLLDEPGAATPAQGVGMFVNAAGEEMEVVNSILEAANNDLSLPKDEILLRDRFKSFIETIIRGAPLGEPQVNQEATEVDKEQFDALSTKVDALANAKPLSAEDVAGIVANALKPITDAAEAAALSAKTELVNKVVEAKLLTKEVAEASPVETLSALANAIVQTPLHAFRVNSTFKPSDKTDRAALAPKGDA